MSGPYRFGILSVIALLLGCAPLSSRAAEIDDRSVPTVSEHTFDAAMLSRPGQDDIQDVLADDYYSNMLLYPKWQQWMRTHHPRTLIVWGRGDYIFGPVAASAYKRDLPQAKLVFYNGGHFVLEEYAPEVSQEIIAMFSREAK
jgi:pimeloyl-ACP methyl ester carboxylesterase